ncbi:Hydrolase in cluster with beta-lactamase (HAD superfamily) [Streptococcus sp. DD10]|uniref:Cof-type HAD-IIB family hydrolase n=1 Tax=Streptococcus sp. DD10 TaxID=1777878 RepID=UPI0007928D29|nr:Cof-type HAD-IIB family hydrolase [Streptococcus sp. DD10]KXT74630.1 Hydrolase in cluster with beta-lactamase (HAD superfamily) [Streptococcus sp. DD10]
MIKLIATDMDGTLLDGTGQLDLPRLERILDELDKRGIHFVIATGNEINRMRLLLGPLIERVALVVANGARLFKGNQLIAYKCWEDDLVKQGLSFFRGRETTDQLVVSTLNGGFVKEGTQFSSIDQFMTPEQAQAFYKRLNFVEEFHPDLFDGVLKMSLVVGLERLDRITSEVERHFAGRITAVSSGYGSMDLLQSGVHKAWGLQQLMEEWGVTADQVMAFGDSANDKELLELAGYAYAMENAEESLKKLANYQAPPNHQGGVYQVLEEYLGL